MQSTLTALLWKEWHEHKWKLAALLAVFIIIPASSILHDPEIAVMSLTTLVLLFSSLPAIFIAMGTAAGERARRTAPFLQALPVNPALPLAFKVTLGLLTCLVPMAIATGLIALATELEPWHNTMGGPGLVLLLGSANVVSTYLWTLAIGFRQPTELRVGLVGLAVVFLGALAAGLAIAFSVELPYSLYRAGLPDSATLQYFVDAAALAIASSSPISGLFAVFAFDPTSLPSIAFFAIATTAHAIAWAALLAVIFYRNTRSATAPPLHASPQPQAGNRPAPYIRPFHSPWTALAYLQYREARPLVLLAVGLIIVLAGGFAMVNLLGRYSSPRFTEAAEEGVLTAVIALGVFLPIAVAVGTFAPPLQPKLREFWQSRPISIDQWFWGKFIVGAACVLIPLYLPVLPILPDWANYGRYWGAGAAPNFAAVYPWYSEKPFAYLVVMPFAHLATYAIAVLVACVLRQTTYAGILALILMAALMMIPVGDPILLWISTQDMYANTPYEGIWDERPLHPQYPLYVLAMLTLTAACAALARYSVNKPLPQLATA